MKFPSLDIYTYRSGQDKVRLCFWIYMLLLIFEGALRKWFLPGLSDALLVVRDPFALYVVILALKYKYLQSRIVEVLIWFTIICFFTTLLFGHQNLFVAIYGARITMIHIPCIFIFGKALTKEDLYRIGKATLYISILMFFILLLQYFSPQSAWINLGVGGTGTAGFQGVEDYFRPSGTFSFTSGMGGFELLVGIYIFYYMYNNNTFDKKYQLSKTKLLIVSILFFFSVFLCLSRTIIFQTLLLFGIMVLYPFIVRGNTKKSIGLLFVVMVSFLILYQIDMFRIAVDNVFLRFDQASEVEGDVVKGSIGERFFGSFYRAFFNTQNFSKQENPLFGFGLGIGTKVGENILGIHSMSHSFAFAEEEWSRVICEIGYLQGAFLLLIIRLLYPIALTLKGLRLVKVRKDSFLLLTIIPFLIYIVNGQWATPTTLGFTVVISSLFMASYNQNKYVKSI